MLTAFYAPHVQMVEETLRRNIYHRYMAIFFRRVRGMCPFESIHLRPVSYPLACSRRA